MDFRVIRHDSLDREEWENLALNGSFFHTSEWIDICVDGLSPHVDAVYLCAYDSGRLTAGMPAIVTNRYRFKSFIAMPYGTYGEVLFKNNASEGIRKEFYSHLVDYLKKNRFSRIDITDFDGGFAEYSNSFLKRKTSFTHIISLDGNKDYRPPDKKIEGHIRAGRRADTSIEHLETSGQINDFYRLYRLTERRHGRHIPLYNKRFFKSILRQLRDSDSMIWNILLADETMIGSCINFIHGNTLFNWQTVSDYDNRHLKPNHILLYDAISKGIKAGVKKVNLGASPHNAHGLIDYKERWGGIRVDYNMYSSYSWLRKLMSR